MHKIIIIQNVYETGACARVASGVAVGVRVEDGIGIGTGANNGARAAFECNCDEKRRVKSDNGDNIVNVNSGVNNNNDADDSDGDGDVGDSYSTCQVLPQVVLCYVPNCAENRKLFFILL